MSLSFSSAHRLVFLLSSLLFLAACDGGSSSTVQLASEVETELENPVKLNVNAVKGPLAGAKVNFYSVDLTTGDIGRINRASKYFFERLYSYGVRYDNGSLQFISMSDTESFAALLTQAIEDKVVGDIEFLKEQVSEATNLTAATGLIQNHLASETNTYYSGVLQEILNSFAGLRDLQRRVEDLPTLISSLEDLREESSDGDLSFTTVINQAQSFASTETNGTKRGHWESLIQALESLRLSEASISTLNQTIDAIYEEGVSAGWFNTDLVAERQLARLERDVANASNIFEADDFISQAYEYEGNTLLKARLKELRDSIISARDAYELILEKGAFSGWSTTQLITSYSSVSGFFTQFVTDVEQSIESALESALVSENLNPTTNRPDNWLGQQLTGTNATTSTFDLESYEGLVYLEVDTEDAKDIGSGQTTDFRQLRSLIHTSSIRGAGDNSKQDVATKLYLDGELLRFDDGSLIFNISDSRLTSEQQEEFKDARPVFQSRSVSPFSTLTLSGGVHWALSDRRWIKNSVLGDDSQETALPFSSSGLNAYLDDFASVVYRSFSGVSEEVDSVRDVSLLYTEESMFEPKYQRDIVRSRFVNEYISSLVQSISDFSGHEHDALLAAIAEDLSDAEIDGLTNDQTISLLQSVPNIAAFAQLDPAQYLIPGDTETLDRLVQVMREEFSSVLPADYDLSEIDFSSSEFSFVAPVGGLDSDGDGTLDNSDAFPLDPSRTRDIPVDYDGLWGLSVDESSALASRFNGTASFSISVETVRGDCTIAVPCIAIGDNAVAIQDDWSIVSGPSGGDMVISEPSDGSIVGFQAQATVPGLYTVQGRLTTAELPTQIYTFKKRIKILDPANFDYSLDPASPRPGETANILIRTTDDLCSAYSVCTGVSVGVDSVNINLLDGDLVATWQQGSAGLSSVGNQTGTVQNVDYGQTWDLYIRQVDTGFKEKVSSVVLGNETDSDGDGVVDRLDVFPGDGSCSSRNDGFDLGNVIAQKVNDYIARFPDRASGLSSELTDSGICFETLKADYGLEPPQPPSQVLAGLGLDLFYISELDLVFLQDSTTKEYANEWVLDPPGVVRFFIEDPVGNRIYLVMENEEIRYIDLDTNTIARFVESRSGFEINSAPTAINGHLLVEFEDAAAAPLQVDEVVVFDQDGAELEFSLDSKFPAAGRELNALLGGMRPTERDADFSVSWSLKREEAGVSPVNYVDVPNLRVTENSTRLSSGQTIRGDVVEATLSYSGLDIATLFVPVIAVDDFAFDLRYPRDNEDVIVVTSGSSVSISEIETYIDVKWFVNGETVDDFVEYTLSKEAPYMLSNTVTNYGDIIRAEIWFNYGLTNKISELTTIIIGEPSDYVPVLDAPAVVTGRNVNVTLGAATTNDQFLSKYFTPFWRTGAGDILDGFGNLLDTQTFNADLPYGGTLLVGYRFNIEGNQGESKLLQIVGPDIDPATSVYGLADGFYAPGDVVALDGDDFGAGDLANFKGSWFVNGIQRVSNGELSFETEGGSFGDVVTLFMEEDDLDPTDNVDPVRFSESASTVLGYGFEPETDGDTDGDGVINSADYFVFDPACSSQTDGRPDDFDMDGLVNLDELDLGMKTFKSYLRLADSDGDGLKDSEEIDLGTDPLNPDTDGDGNSDYYEAYLANGFDPLVADVNQETADPAVDQDRDGIPDSLELTLGTRVNVADTDGDGLEDGYELYTTNTDPLDPDSDGDGLWDGLEVLVTKTDPLDADTDGDLISDGFEVDNNYNPNSTDTNSDGISDSDDWPAEQNVVGNASDIKIGMLGDYRYGDDFSPLPQGTCYATWLSEKGAAIIVATDLDQDVGSDQIIAMAGGELEQIYLYDSVAGAFLPPVPERLLNGVTVNGVVAQNATVTALSFETGANSDDTLYAGFESGLIRIYDLTGAEPAFVTAFDPYPGVQGSVSALFDQGAFLIVEFDLAAGDFRQALLDKTDGSILHQFDSSESIAGAVWNNDSKTRLWSVNESLNSVFTAFDYNPGTPNLSAQVSPANLNVGNLPLQGPIFVDQSNDIEAVRFSSGELYLTGTQSFQDADSTNAKAFRVGTTVSQTLDDNGTPGNPADDVVMSHAAYVNGRNELELVFYPDTANDTEFWSFTENLVDAQVKAVVPLQEDLVLLEELRSPTNINQGKSYYSFTRKAVGDSDIDGLPGWYEDYSGLDDTDAADATLAANDIGGQSRLAAFQNFSDISSYLVDSDGDGIGDSKEDELFASPAAKLNRDSDFDGLTDAQEVALNDLANFDPENSDSNSNGILDGAEDTDSDGLSNSEELNVYFTDPQVADTDADGVSDYFEVFTLNTDPLVGATFDIDFDGTKDPDGTSDFDGDGLANQDEESAGTDPYSADTDGDGLSDNDEVNVHPSDPLLADSDFDGISDYAEVNDPNLDPNDDTDANADLDGDGLTNIQEVGFGSDLNNTDTDGDTLSDFYEVTLTPARQYITSPILADTDKDGVLNDAQEEAGTVINVTVTDCSGVSNTYLNWVSRPDMPDSDGDGLSDLEELDLDGGRAFLSNPLLQDTDGDGLTDFEEFDFEFEYDGSEIIDLGFDPSNPPGVLASPVDCDTDGDGLTDLEEFNARSNIAEQDTDNDFLYDPLEISLGLQVDNSDADGDGLADGFEYYLTGTSPSSKDTDLNGIDDGDEDPDGDGLTNYQELYLTFTDPLVADSGDVINNNGSISSVLDADGDMRTRVWIWDGGSITFNGSVNAGNIRDKDLNVLFPNNFVFIEAGNGINDADEDADKDLLSNIAEIQLGTDPWNQDTDGDGVSDGDEVFGNPGDNILPSDPLDEDTDKDGLTDLEEVNFGTDPRNVDSDGDGLQDGDEVTQGLNPTSIDSDGDFLNDNIDPNGLDIDIDGDGLPDIIELYLGTDPNSGDTDGDGISDGQEVWVFAYDNQGDLLRFGLDGDNDLELDDVFNSRDGDITWVPAELSNFDAAPFRASIDLVDAAGIDQGTAYIWYISNPDSNDSDGDGLTDTVELLRIEDDVTGGLDLDAGLDLTNAGNLNNVLTENRFAVSNPLKTDSDNDGVEDGFEDYDFDYLNNISDASISEASVVIADSDFNIGDPADRDGLLDGVEVNVLGTLSNDSDTDGDGIDDGSELSVTFVSSDLASSTGTNPYIVNNLSECQVDETPLEVAGVNYCFIVGYISFPTEDDSDADAVLDGLDYYPLDPACSEQTDGFDDPARPQCYATWMAEQPTAGKVVYIDDPAYREVAILGEGWDSLIRYDYSGGEFKPHTDASSYKFSDYEYDTERLYLVGENGELSVINLVDDTVQVLPDLSAAGIVALKAVSSHLLVQEGEGASATLRLYDLSSNLVDSLAVPFIELENGVWLADEQKLYAYTNGATVDDLLSLEINAGFVGAPIYAAGTWANLSGKLTRDLKGTLGTADDRILVPSGYAVPLDLNLVDVENLSDSEYFGSNFESSYDQIFASYKTLNSNNESYYVASYLDESELGSASSLAEVNSVQVQVNADRPAPLTSVTGDHIFPARRVDTAVWGLASASSDDDEVFEVIKRNGTVRIQAVGMVDYDGDLMPCFFERSHNLVELANGSCGMAVELGNEGQFADPDQDGLVNFEEYIYLTNPRNEDSDEDGWEDLYEINRGTDPLDASDF